MSNCRPGDIAIVVHDPDFSGRDIGAFVEVLGPSEDLDCWHCRSSGRRLAFFVKLFSLEFPLGRGRECDIPDAWLRPIRGLPAESLHLADQFQKA